MDVYSFGKGVASKYTQIEKDIRESREEVFRSSPKFLRRCERKGIPGPKGPKWSQPASRLAVSSSSTSCVKAGPISFRNQNICTDVRSHEGHFTSQAGVFGTWELMEEQQRGKSSEVDLGKSEESNIHWAGVVVAVYSASCGSHV